MLRGLSLVDVRGLRCWIPQAGQCANLGSRGSNDNPSPAAAIELVSDRPSGSGMLPISARPRGSGSSGTSLPLGTESNRFIMPCPDTGRRSYLEDIFSAYPRGVCAGVAPRASGPVVAGLFASALDLHGCLYRRLCGDFGRGSGYRVDLGAHGRSRGRGRTAALAARRRVGSGRAASRRAGARRAVVGQSSAVRRSGCAAGPLQSKS